MLDLVELKITNNYAEKANDKKKEETIYIDGDCCITNYGPDGNGKKNGNITIESKNNNISIFYGRNDKRESSEKADLSPEKYELLLEIAKLHDDDGKKGNKIILSNEDIKEYKELKGYNSKFSVRQDFTTDYEVIRLVENKNNETLLRINFNAKPEKVSKVTKTDKTNKINKTDNDPYLQKLFDKYIPEDYAEYISKAAIQAGVSENFIKFLIFTEGRVVKGKFRAALKTYYDSKGIPTIAFGHTNQTGTYEINLNTEISLQKAFDILVMDIKHHKDNVINKVGKDFYNKLIKERPSLAEALIDFSFNAGTKRFQESDNVKMNIDNKCYRGLATRSLWNEDDPRRSYYRMLYATSYMSKKDRAETFKFLDQEQKTKSESYYKSLKKTLVGDEEKSAMDTIAKIRTINK